MLLTAIGDTEMQVKWLMHGVDVKMDKEGFRVINLGQLKEIKDLRKVWPHEALDFTPWLAKEDNLSLLSDTVGLEITVDETESSVGDFNVDIYATETGTDRKIIIENQLEDTNHDHLGKLITYASGKAADIAVKFEVIEKPNDWAKEIKRQTSSSPTLQARYDYWVAFNEYAFNNAAFAKVFSRRKASTDHWMSLSVGSSACHIDLSQVRKGNNITVEWYITDDKELYQKFYSHKADIEQDMEMALDWRELPDKKASRILVIHEADFDNKDKWPEQFDWKIGRAHV